MRANENKMSRRERGRARLRIDVLTHGKLHSTGARGRLHRLVRPASGATRW